jgi:hypothetical protein
MEFVNHAMPSRKELREFISEKGMTQRVLVPEDGESLRFFNGFALNAGRATGCDQRQTLISAIFIKMRPLCVREVTVYYFFL